jgi:hypothetical protein
MISFPTTSTGEVRKVGKWTPKQHPHHHLLRGVGVWWGSGKLEIAGGENQGVGGLPVPRCRRWSLGCAPARARLIVTPVSTAKGAA